MGVLLRLGDAQLGHAHAAEVFAQAVLDRHTGPRHQHVGHGGVILGVAHIGGGEELPLETVKIGIHDGAGDLPCPVGAVVEEDDAVVVADGALAVADHRLHEFVGDAVGVGLGHRVHGVGVVDALAVDHGVIGHLHALPALVAIHGVIAAHHRGDPAHADLGAFVPQLRHEVLAAGGGHVAAVQEAVDVHLGQALVLCHLQQGEQMLDVGVYAAVGQQTVQVQAAALGQTVVHGLVIGIVFEEAAIVDGAADAGQILEHHTASADVGVAHLAVAHLPGGQTHIQSAGGQGGVGVFLEQPVKHRRFRQGHGVVVAGGSQAEAVHNDQRSRRLVHDRTPFLRYVSPGWRR